MLQTTVPSTGGQIVHRPSSTKSRLILPFEIQSCCFPGIGIASETTPLPPELNELGVDENQWKIYIKKLETEIQPLSPTGCENLCYAFMGVFGFVCCLFHSQGKYQSALKRWLDELNENVLGNRNLYAKIETNERKELYSGRSEAISWLAISLTLEDSKQLREEPVLWKPKCCAPNLIAPQTCQNVFFCCGPKRFV